MLTAKTLCEELLQIKDIIVENIELARDVNQVMTLKLTVRPSRAAENRCPFCGKKCHGYDTPHSVLKIWRHLDFGGIIVMLMSQTHRICCPEHGVVT